MVVRRSRSKEEEEEKEDVEEEEERERKWRNLNEMKEESVDPYFNLDPYSWIVSFTKSKYIMIVRNQRDNTIATTLKHWKKSKKVWEVNK